MSPGFQSDQHPCVIVHGVGLVVDVLCSLLPIDWVPIDWVKIFKWFKWPYFFLKDLDLDDLDDLNDLGDLSDGLQMGRAWAEYRQSTVRRYKRLERRQVSGSFFDSFRHQCRDFVLFIIMLARGHHAEDRANELGWEEIWILKTWFSFLREAATVYIVYGRDSWKRNSRRRESWKGTWGEEAGSICCERSESFSV